MILGVALVLLSLGVGAIHHGFLAPENLWDIAVNASIPAVAAAGMTAVIVAAQIDISIGSILAVCAVAVALLGGKGWPLPAILVASTAVGAVLGSVNGGLCAGLGIPSIVATLATMGAIRGLLVLVTHGDTISVPDPLTSLNAVSLAGRPGLLLLVGAIVVCAGMAVYLARTRGGRQYYAIGSNPRSATLSGIPVRWVTFRSFVLLGALTGVAGFLTACHLSPVSPSPPPGWELEVITAVVVGGTDIFGGRGTVLGTVMAALLLSTIRTALPFIASFAPGLRSEIQPAVQGLLILIAVLYDSFSRRNQL